MGDVVGQKVVVDDAPELRLVLFHDGVILVVDEVTAVCRFAFAHVGLAMLFDDVGGNPQSDLAVDPAPTVAVELVVGLLVYEIVAQEPRRLAGGVGYESLLPG